MHTKFSSMSVSYTPLNNLDDLNGGRKGSDGSHKMRDWRRQLRTPPTYRIGNRTFRVHLHVALLCLCFGTLILVFLFFKHDSQSTYSNKRKWYMKYEATTKKQQSEYNSTYPLTPAVVSNGIYTYRIGMIADLDKESKDKTHPNTWRSFLKMGVFKYNSAQTSVEVTFNDYEEPTEIDGSYSEKGRGMELSELVTFNGRMLTFDDRTGLIFHLKENKALPWVLLMDGPGNTGKGFKSEWATVKDEVLYVGSMGKEWTTSAGDFASFDPMYIKAVTTTGEVHHLNWIENYQVIRRALGIEWPGYVLHESAAWSPIKRKWFFLPRRCSKERYNETKDEVMGCNKLISVDENFQQVDVVKLGPYKSTFGFSSFKFVPGTNDNVIVAIMSEEFNGKTATHITVFTTDGKTLLGPIKIKTDFKYEGIDFF